MASIRISEKLLDHLDLVATELKTNKADIAERCYKIFIKSNVALDELLKDATVNKTTKSTHWKFLEGLDITGRQIETICWWALKGRKKPMGLSKEVLAEQQRINEQELNLLKRGL